MSKLAEYGDSLKATASIASYFRRHLGKGGLASLREIQISIANKSKELVLPVATRWSSDLNCAESVYNSRQALMLLACSEAWPTDANAAGIKDNIRSDQFWRDVKLCIDALSPIRKAILFLQSDSRTLSDVYASWIILTCAFQKANKPEVDACVAKRLAFAFHPAHAVALALDPQYILDVNVPVSEVEVALQKLAAYMSRRNPVTMSLDEAALTLEIAAYFDAIRLARNHRDRLLDSDWRPSKLALTRIRWWTTVSDKYPQLSRLAIRLHQLPPSSASAERLWSNADLIISKNRTRLDPDRAEKLMSIYWNTRIFERSPSKDQTYAELTPECRHYKHVFHNMHLIGELVPSVLHLRCLFD
jgi:hypothetical protein